MHWRSLSQAHCSYLSHGLHRGSYSQLQAQRYAARVVASSLEKESGAYVLASGECALRFCLTFCGQLVGHCDGPHYLAVEMAFRDLGLGGLAPHVCPPGCPP